MKNDFKLPHVGQRIIRSVCAVCLCFVVYFLRGCQGIPFYSGTCSTSVHAAVSLKQLKNG